MAIRPVDLQLAYLAGPQNAAAVSHAQDAPQAAQQAVQSAFAAEVVKREESIREPDKAGGQKVRAREEGDRGGQAFGRGGRQHSGRQAPHDQPAQDAGGDHLIDFTA
ncbi:MAG TPA: hypothetical protein VFA29_11215 [Candidatus Baltobacteraceae bacterium]|nr:hypothetical protein [Candidatus Baltobacteraceae bacterium]